MVGGVDGDETVEPLGVHGADLGRPVKGENLITYTNKRIERFVMESDRGCVKPIINLKQYIRTCLSSWE